MNEQQAIKILQEEKSWESDDRKIDAFIMGIEALEEIQQYRAIGTVEELQALKEKSVAKKPRLIMNAMVCPSCPKVYSSDSVTYCTNCGQHLDWE